MFHKLKELSVNLTVYGVGDVAVQIASFLLLPLYVHVLSPSDYGAIALLLTVEQILRVVYRWGIDASFMRFYYDCADQPARQTLASTIFFFLITVSGMVLVAGVSASPVLAPQLFGRDGFTLPLQLVFINTFLGSLSFLPFHVLRIEGRARTYVTLTFSTNLATLVAKFVLVVVVRMGVLGMFLGDLVVAVMLAIVLLPRYGALIRPVFSVPLLRRCLRFGLPRLPHSAAHQVIAGVDRYLLSLFVPLREVGIYGVGASLGLGLKLFLSAFETAGAPFYFNEMHEPDAKETFRTITTYGIGALALLAAGLSAVSFDLVRLMMTPQYYGAATIVPWIGLSVALQGVYLLTSIGLNITRHTEYYPVSTGLAAVASVGLNLLLIPQFGVLGAAWSNVAAYGLLAVSGMAFSQRFYPVRYEWSRLGRLAGAAITATVAARLLLPASVAPLWGVLGRGSCTVVVFVAVLTATGFFQPRELRRIKEITNRLLRRAPATGAPGPSTTSRRSESPHED